MSSCRNPQGQFTRCRVGGAARGRGRRGRYPLGTIVRAAVDMPDEGPGGESYLHGRVGDLGQIESYGFEKGGPWGHQWDWPNIDWNYGKGRGYFTLPPSEFEVVMRGPGRYVEGGRFARGRRSAEDEEWIEDFVDSLESDGDVPVSPPYTAAKKRKLWEVISTESGSKPGSFLFFKIVEELESRGLYPSLPAWQAGMEW